MRKKFIILLLASVFVLSGCGNLSTPKEASKNNTEQLDTSSDNTENSEMNESTEDNSDAPEDASNSSEDILLQIGEEGTLGDWSITVTNAQITDTIKESDYFGFTPEEGNKYFTIDITITNNGKDASKFLPSIGFSDDISAKILYKEEYEYSSTYLIGYSNELHDTSVNPLSTKSGTVTFELPDSVASTDEELVLKFSADKDDLLFKVR